MTTRTRKTPARAGTAIWRTGSTPVVQEDPRAGGDGVADDGLYSC